MFRLLPSHVALPVLQVQLQIQPPGLSSRPAISTTVLLDLVLTLRPEFLPYQATCPHNPEEFHILPTDIFVEITDHEGNPLSEPTTGEITITGGRNPYIPLLRYKTGDRAKLKLETCSCGDPTPRLYDMETREQVLFYNKKNQLVNPIDITRIMKRYPILQYEFKQKKDLSCVLSVNKLHEFTHLENTKFQQELESLFRNEIDLEINFDLDTNGKKPVPYESEIGFNL